MFDNKENIKLFKEYLERNKGWLIIIDNLPPKYKETFTKILNEYIPNKGGILVISCISNDFQKTGYIDIN
jgi:hypothetical protein